MTVSGIGISHGSAFKSFQATWHQLDLSCKLMVLSHAEASFEKIPKSVRRGGRGLSGFSPNLA